MIIRKAQTADIEFLVEAIIHADKSGSDISSYCRTYLISEEELHKALKEILLENWDGFEISPDAFKIAEIDHQPVGAVAAWIEGSSGVASGVKKSTAFALAFPRRNQEMVKRNLTLLSEVTIERAAGTLQIESVYTGPDFRGKGIARALIENQISEFKSLHPGMLEAQVQLMGENESALKTYLGIGFEISVEKTSVSRAIFELLPGNTKLMLVKKI